MHKLSNIVHHHSILKDCWRQQRMQDRPRVSVDSWYEEGLLRNSNIDIWSCVLRVSLECKWLGCMSSISVSLYTAAHINKSLCVSIQWAARHQSQKYDLNVTILCSLTDHDGFYHLQPYPFKRDPQVVTANRNRQNRDPRKSQKRPHWTRLRRHLLGALGQTFWHTRHWHYTQTHQEKIIVLNFKRQMSCFKSIQINIHTHWCMHIFGNFCSAYTPYNQAQAYAWTELCKGWLTWRWGFGLQISKTTNTIIT